MLIDNRNNYSHLDENNGKGFRCSGFKCILMMMLETEIDPL